MSNDLIMHRVDRPIVDVLDAKRGLETRASYLRRSIEVVLYGAPRSKSTHVTGHRVAESAPGVKWIQLRVPVAEQTHRDMLKRVRASGQSYVDFLRQTILESQLAPSFPAAAPTVALAINVPPAVARRVDVAALTAYVLRTWGA